MLSKLSIKNFQIHRDISFLFHKGVNVISGTSGSGKSACIRAEESIKNYLIRRLKEELDRLSLIKI